MDPSIQSLLPIQKLGADGAAWWVGQVEAIDEPKISNRFRVRIVGEHSKSGDEVKTEDLPWAKSALPVTTPYKEGGSSGATANLEEGCWVVGIWLDPERTKPLILASIGTTANAADQPPDMDEPSEGDSLEFKTKVNRKTNPVADLGAKADETNKNRSSGQIAGSSPATHSVQDGSHAGKNSRSNPFGSQVCVKVAQADCSSDTRSDLKYVLGELFQMVQESGGNLGDYLVNRVSGEIFSYSRTAYGYINKILKIIRTALARIKGEIIAKLKEGIEALVKMILSPIEGVLETVQQWLEVTLEKIGCSIEDIYERLVDFITKLIFDYLLKVFRAATCQVDIFVNAILSKIMAFVDRLIGSILGPLQQILSIAANAINLVGSVVFKIMSILGISCGGVDSKCSDTETSCNKKKKDEVDDFLDGILAGLENGNLDYGSSVCQDARGYEQPEKTDGIIYGGLPVAPSTPPGGSPIDDDQDTPDDSVEGDRLHTYEIFSANVLEGDIAKVYVRRSGHIEISSGLSFRTKDGSAEAGLDYIAKEGFIGFGQNQTERVIEIQTLSDTEYNEGVENFVVEIDYSTGVLEAEFITKEADVLIGLQPEDPLIDPEYEVPPGIGPGTPPIEPPELPGGGGPDTEVPIDNPVVPEDLSGKEVSVFVTSDKLKYSEGEFITYTIQTDNVPNNTIFSYVLFGSSISAQDIVGGNLAGTFEIVDNQAVVVIGIANDGTIEGDESMSFSVNGTGASTTVIIQDVLTPDDVITDPTDPISDPGFTPPTIGEPVVDEDGKIIEIPIDDPGDPYVIPPNIAITGQGWGAMAVPILDRSGRVTEIRITQRGRNFIPNKNENLDCVIDSLTLTRPGSGYTEVPRVYVNGQSGIVVARINGKGQVVGFDVVTRGIIYEKAPTIEIIGNGFGAKALASMSCLDSDTRDRLGYAKIGTGRYVDCPT